MEEYGIIVLMALGFALALFFGYITQRLKLSPIVGYLVAGIIVGPYGLEMVEELSPFSLGIGDKVDVFKNLAHQLAEIGVILLMFVVGLHFHLKDLLAVKWISVPGAVGQSLVTTILGMILAHAMGWSWATGLILGMSVSVASTVVLVRALTDNNVLNTSQGHIAVGWLIVEDIFTILILVLLPAMKVIMDLQDVGSDISPMEIIEPLSIALGKIGLLAFIVLAAGKKIMPWLLMAVARTRSRELFTLSILAIAFLIASISAFVFGASFALGAFLAGMAVGQTNVGEEAAADALPMKDAFGVIFFVSVGMLFNPYALFNNLPLFLVLMVIVIAIKPLVAFLIVVLLGRSSITGFTVALAIAQIGEFTFILALEAKKLSIQVNGQLVPMLSPLGESMLIATAIFSIALNPILFKTLPLLESALRSQPRLWNLFNHRAFKKAKEGSHKEHKDDGKELAVIVGYGPVGRSVAKMLEKAGVQISVIDMNVDTVATINQGQGRAVFGDASKADILRAAGIEKAKYLVVTPPELNLRLPVICAARNMNSKIVIYSRARYISEKNALENYGVKVCYEELESAVILAETVLRNQGFTEEQIAQEVEDVRKELIS
jgi:CPA2 family monovalent cation:H+ antiporter-2